MYSRARVRGTFSGLTPTRSRVARICAFALVWVLHHMSSVCAHMHILLARVNRVCALTRTYHVSLLTCCGGIGGVQSRANEDIPTLCSCAGEYRRYIYIYNIKSRSSNIERAEQVIQISYECTMHITYYIIKSAKCSKLNA